MGVTTPHRRGFPRWSLGEAGVAAGDDDDRRGHPRRRLSLQWCVCVQLVWVARVVVCALAMNVLHEGRQGCSFQVSVGFPLINRPTIFCLINENEKYFGS